MRTKHTLILSFLLLALVFMACPRVLAQEAGPSLEQTAQEYFARHDHDGFDQYLTGLIAQGATEAPDIYFYRAFNRQSQIKYWQETKNWEGIYDKAEDYRKAIAEDLLKAEGSKEVPPTMALGIKYLRWQVAKDSDPDHAAEFFDSLVRACAELASSPGVLKMTKDIADELSVLEDKNLSRRLYEAYVSKLLLSAPAAEDLKKNAVLFLAEKNLYLAKTLFDAYLAQLADDKVKQAKETAAVASFFAHADGEEGLDPVFAEELYRRAFDAAGMEAFDALTQYRRAFNLERTKEYEAAIAEYKKALDAFADQPKKSPVLFRLGVLSAYALKDPDAAAQYFTKVREEAKGHALALSSLYQLGLLSQYRGDTEKAKEFYGACLDLEKAQVPAMEASEICRLAAERLLEIEEAKEIKYGLRLFLDAALKESPAPALSLNVDVTGRPFVQEAAAPVRFVVTTSAPATGCMTPEYSYEWSGEVGSLAQVPNAPEITTDYPTAGIKVIHTAVVGPNGLEGAGFDMVEIMEKP